MATNHAPRPSDPARAAHLDKLLDQALEATFPASDPIAIAVESPYALAPDSVSSSYPAISGGRRHAKPTL